MNTDISATYKIRSLAHTANETIYPAVRVGVALFLAWLFYELLSRDLITNSQGLVAFSSLLLSYLFVEIKNLWTRDNDLFWINPVVLASIFTFVLAFGVTNVLYFLPEDMVALVGLRPVVTPWMNWLMLLVILGACAMWLGYNSGVGRNLGQLIQRSHELHKWMSSSLRVSRITLYVLLAISLTARLITIALGLYGYSSSYDQLIAAAAYTQYLTMAESLGKIGLVGVAMQRFASPVPALSDRQLLWFVLAYEVAFGFLSGFKSAVVMPIIIVGFVYYSQRNRFPRWLIPAVVAGVMAAYAWIEPFRTTRNEDTEFVGTTIGGIASAMPSFNSIGEDDGDGSASTGLSVLARSNLTYIASLGIEYAANNELPEGSPEFLGDIVLAPAHALIPRLLWDSKSLQNIGLWYTNEVMGLNFISSTGMSPFTYLNFAGGPSAVFLGFFTVGVLQRGLFDGLRGFGGGGLIVLFGLLGTLVNIDSAFNTFLVGIIRFLPILLIVQSLLLQPSRSDGAVVGA